MKGKLNSAVLPLGIILLAGILFGLGSQIYMLQGQVSELNTQIAYLEYEVSPHLEFIEKYVIVDIDAAEMDDSAIPFDIEKMEKIRDKIGRKLKEEYPDQVIDLRSPDADR